ncbi:MAG: hypothetical protein WAO95_04235 [Burkholderiales bacterium]
MNMKVFGLLHLAENQKTAVNLSTRDFREQVSVYVNNARVLAKSLSLRGVAFGLLTNDRLLIEKCASTADDGFSLEIIEIPFLTKVPSGIRFFSAHHKIDAFRYLASLEGSYYALCDLDMVCINDVPTCLHNLIKARIPLCYDISDQVIPAYGHDVIIRDLSTIGGLASEGRWSGGEFVSGTPEFFKKLVNEIDDVYENYIANVPSMHHVGDEAVTSSALERLKRQGIYIADAGNLFIVGRYWNTRVRHPQKPFAYFNHCFLLHLPADKNYISTLAGLEAEGLAEFVSAYEKNLGSLPSKLKNWKGLVIRFITSALSKALQLTVKRRR